MLHIVDDEEVIRDSLMWLAESRHIQATAYDSASQFLSVLDSDYVFNDDGDCLLLDMRMPEMSGASLFEAISARGFRARMPVIFLTGHADVPMAVDSLKRGAFDFFEKPFNDNKLMDRVQEALLASVQGGLQADVQARLATLSTRERETLGFILEGKMNKVIADEMGITMRTVEVHRASIFTKMGVRTAVELARLIQ